MTQAYTGIHCLHIDILDWPTGMLLFLPHSHQWSWLSQPLCPCYQTGVGYAQGGHQTQPMEAVSHLAWCSLASAWPLACHRHRWDWSCMVRISGQLKIDLGSKLQEVSSISFMAFLVGARNNKSSQNLKAPMKNLTPCLPNQASYNSTRNWFT